MGGDETPASTPAAQSKKKATPKAKTGPSSRASPATAGGRRFSTPNLPTSSTSVASSQILPVINDPNAKLAASGGSSAREDLYAFVVLKRHCLALLDREMQT